MLYSRNLIRDQVLIESRSRLISIVSHCHKKHRNIDFVVSHVHDYTGLSYSQSLDCHYNNYLKPYFCHVWSSYMAFVIVYCELVVGAVIVFGDFNSGLHKFSNSQCLFCLHCYKTKSGSKVQNYYSKNDSLNCWFEILR